MKLALVLDSLPDATRRHEAAYQRARAAEPSFAPYPTALALFDALAPKSPLSLDERQVLVRALIQRLQTERRPPWQSFLLHAFAPMLWSLRARDVGRRDGRDERVVLAFLQVIADVRLHGQPIFIAVQRATARELFDAVLAELRQPETEALEENEATVPTALHVQPDQFTRCLAREVAELLCEHEGGQDIACALAELATDDAQVDGTSPLGSGATATACERQRRARILKQVRAKAAREPERRRA